MPLSQFAERTKNNIEICVCDNFDICFCAFDILFCGCADFLQEGGEQLGFGTAPDGLAEFEDHASAVAAGDAQVGVRSLAGAIDFAAHHGDFSQGDGFPCGHQAVDFGFHGFGDGDEVDARAPAGRAGDQLRAAWSQP